MSRKRKENFEEDDYDSSFEDEESEESKERRTKKTDLIQRDPAPNLNPSGSSQGLPSKEYFQQELTRAESYRNRYFALNAYERHRKLINDYFLYHPGVSPDNLFKRDTSKDKRDLDIIRDNHRFLWNEDDEPDTWEKQLAKRYYDKLYKEYCICDLSRYKENKVAMRWRIEKELVDGKGQFSCGARKCSNAENLRTWEVNFAYMEESVKKNALVKLRLCPECSIKLNYGQKRKEVTKSSKRHSHSKKHNRKSSKRDKVEDGPSSSKGHDRNDSTNEESRSQEEDGKPAENIWKKPVVAPDIKSREEEFEDYLDDLFV